MNKIKKILVVLVLVLLFFEKNAEAQGGPPPPPPPPKTVPIDGLSGLLVLLGAGYILRKFCRVNE